MRYGSAVIERKNIRGVWEPVMRCKTSEDAVVTLLRMVRRCVSGVVR